MTRINLIPVTDLHDQHLMAEYRELPRIFTYVEKLKEIPKDIPSSYTMGKGHVKFFADKLKFLMKRQFQITEELLDRNFKINFDARELYARYVLLDSKFKNDYIPSDQELAISRQRIDEKLAEKPGWYRKTTRILE